MKFYFEKINLFTKNEKIFIFLLLLNLFFKVHFDSKIFDIENCWLLKIFDFLFASSRFFLIASRIEAKKRRSKAKKEAIKSISKIFDKQDFLLNKKQFNINKSLKLFLFSLNIKSWKGNKNVLNTFYFLAT